MMDFGNRVYLETSFISYLAAKDSTDIFVVTRQRESRDWWENSRNEFEVFVSDAVHREAARGNATYAKQRLELLDGLEILDTTDAVLGLARELVRRKAVPENAEEDAVHIAVAAVHNRDFLLTWNFRHINNLFLKLKIAEVCKDNEFQFPQIGSPQELKRGLK